MLWLRLWNDLGFLLAMRVIALLLHALTCALAARAECNSTRFTFKMSKERRKVCRVPATVRRDRGTGVSDLQQTAREATLQLVD